MDSTRLLELAGVNENRNQSGIEQGDIPRLDYLIEYYIEGFGEFQHQPNADTENALNAVKHLRGKDLYNLSAEEGKMAQAVLAYGSDV